MIDIVTYQWGTICKPEHTAILYAMCKRHIHCEFRFTVITDNVNNYSKNYSGINVIEGRVKPGLEQRCYRRLQLFSKDAKDIFPDKIILLDLDIVITGDITDIVNTDVEFAAYNKGHVPYQGAFIMLKPGTRTQVWDDFDIETSPALCRGYSGSDQAWISHKLPPGEKVFTREDGLYCYDVDRFNMRQIIPTKVKMVFFRNVPKPWSIHPIKHMWLRHNYKL